MLQTMMILSFPTFQMSFGIKLRLTKMRQARFQRRRGEGREKRKISVQSCSLYWNFVSVTICCAELMCQLWIHNVPKPKYCCRA
jgi:hypothetical protein